MITRLKRSAALLIALGFMVAAAAGPAMGQGFGGSSRGGRSFGGGGTLRIVLDESAQESLKLSDDQIKKLEEIQESSQSGGSDFGAIQEKLRSAESDEARQAIFAEMQADRERRTKETDAKVTEVLNDEQRGQLRVMVVQREGLRALSRDDIAAELKLNDDQRKKLADLNKEYQAARMSSFRMPREEREAQQKKFEDQMTGVLSDEQKTVLAKMQAKPDEGEEAKPASYDPKPTTPAASTPAVATETTSPSPAPSETPAASGDEAPADANVVMSFGDGTGKLDKDEKMSFNFQYAPWPDVLKMFARTAGLTLHLRDIPPGTFNYLDQGEYTSTEAIDILNGYLLQEGYLLVRRDKFLVCVGFDEKFGNVPPNLIPNVTVDELAKRGNNEMVSVVFPLSGADAEKAAVEVTNLLGPQGQAVGLTTADSLYVRDTGANLRKIKELLDRIVPDPTEDAQFKAYPLENILASEAESQVRSLFGLQSAVKNVSASASGETQSRFSRGGSSDPRFRGAPQQTPQRSSTASASSTSSVKVASDYRTNSLLVTATEKEHEVVKDVIASIDVPENAEIAARARAAEPYLQVYKLNKADATEVTKTLDALMPGVVVNEDGRNRLIHIQATPTQHQEVAELIRRLDGGMSQDVDIIRLSRYDSAAMAAMLSSVFIKDGADAPTIQAESLTRTLIVRGSKDQIAQVRQLLLGFGEDGTGVMQDSMRQGGRVRTVPLGGRDPVKFAKMLEGVLSGTKDFDNEIRVIVPSTEDPEEAQPEPERRIPSEPGARGVNSLPGASISRPSRGIRVVRTGGDPSRYSPSARTYYTSTQVAEDEGSVEVESAARPQRPAGDAAGSGAAKPTNGLPPVTIRVSGGDLVIYSSDEALLDRVEDMISDLSEQLPPETTWTVFYLRIADATEASSMLEQLIPNANVSSVAGSSGALGSLGDSLSSMGGSLMNMTGLSDLGAGPTQLRIIPDVRSNSLFVTGPADEVENVERFLKILDSNEVPDSLRDRTPRTIEVLYADVNDVAGIIREVYKDYLEDPSANRQQRGGGGNPFAAMMGGGGQSSGRSAGIRLTLAVDTNTSELIVSCDEPTFQAISRLVQQRDLAAYEARRTVRVVTLDEAKSAIVQQAITALIPKVNVSTTGTSGRPSVSGSRPSGGGSTPTQPGGGSSDAERAARIQQFMQMRGGFGGGAGGRGGFGGSTGGRPTGGATRGGFGGGATGGRGGTTGGGRGGFGGFGGRGGR